MTDTHHPKHKYSFDTYREGQRVLAFGATGRVDTVSHDGWVWIKFDDGIRRATYIHCTQVVKLKEEKARGPL
jgi:hypothetical protein